MYPSTQTTLNQTIRERLSRHYHTLIGISTFAMLITIALLLWERWTVDSLFSYEQPLLDTSHELQKKINIHVAQVDDLSHKFELRPELVNRFTEKYELFRDSLDTSTPVNRDLLISNRSIADTVNQIRKWYWRIQDNWHSERYLQEQLSKQLFLLAEERFTIITLLLTQTHWNSTTPANSTQQSIQLICADIRGFGTNSTSKLAEFTLSRKEKDLNSYHYYRKKLDNALQHLQANQSQLSSRTALIASALFDTDRELKTIESQLIQYQQQQQNLHQLWVSNHLLPLNKQLNQQIGKLNSQIKQRIDQQKNAMSFALNSIPILLVTLLLALLFAGKRLLNLMTARIVQPTEELMSASQALAEGKLTSDIPIRFQDELGSLTESFNRMRASIIERQTALQESEQYLIDIFANAGDGIISTDSKGNIDIFNPAAEKIFGYSYDQVHGRNIRLLVPKSIGHKHDHFIKQYLIQGQSRIIGRGREVEGVDAQGNTLSLHVTVTHLKRKTGDIFVSTVKDYAHVITSRNQLLEANRSLELRSLIQDYIEKIYQAGDSANNVEEFTLKTESILERFFQNCQINMILLDQEKGTLHHKQTTLSKSNRLYKVLEQQSMRIDNFESDNILLKQGSLSIVAQGYLAMPLALQEKNLGILELITCRPLQEQDNLFLQQTVPVISARLSLKQKQATDQLLKTLTKQADELKRQAIELKISEEQAKTINRNLEQKTHELEHQQNELERSYRYKSEFLANMSHELRTPLNSILLLCDLMLNDNEINTETRENVDVIQTSGNNLLRLINEILDLAKAESDRLNLHYQSIDNLTDIFAPIVAEIQPLSDQKELSLNIHFDTLSSPIATDPVRLEQITRNLLTNAVKFTNHGEVTLRVNVDRETLTMVISDTGIGISESEKENVFQAFTQLDRGNARKYGGTGLGLAICKQIILAMKGDISLDSQTDKGSTFTVTLPVGLDQIPSEHSTQQPVALPETQPSERGHQVLIVEDDPTNLESLRRIVEEQGYDAFVANSLQSAEQTYSSLFACGCVVLDISLPDGDGTKLIDTLNLQEKCIPVILFTGTELSDQKIAYYESLNYSIIFKGIDTAGRFRQELAHIMKRAPHQTQPSTPPNPSYISIPTPQHPINLEGAAGKTILLVDDDPRNCFVISKALKKGGHQVLLAEDGLVALKRLEEEVSNVDLILMDTMMPNMDGLECIRQIRQQPLFQHLPIISITAKAAPKDRSECLAAGANDYLSKPVTAEALMSKIMIWLLEPQDDLQDH